MSYTPATKQVLATELTAQILGHLDADNDRQWDGSWHWGDNDKGLIGCSYLGIETYVEVSKAKRKQKEICSCDIVFVCKVNKRNAEQETREGEWEVWLEDHDATCDRSAVDD